MPTYTCWSQAGVISPQARASVAAAITDIHHEVAEAPRYLVQVIFADLSLGSQFLGGKPVEGGYVWIRVDLRAGRDEDVKRGLLLRMVREVAEIVGLAPDQIRIYICEIPGPNIAEYGQIMPRPGGEEAWFAGLPQQTQDRLAKLA